MKSSSAFRRTGTTPRRSTVDVMSLVALLAVIVIGVATIPADSAAAMDNGKQQMLLDSEEISEMMFGGCDDGRVVNCRTLPLFNYTELTPPPVGAEADILQDDTCPYKNLERHLRCVDVFTRRCLTTEQRGTFYKLYSKPVMDMQELCTEGGPHREEYLKHAACLRTVHSEYIKCGRQHQRELAALMMDRGDEGISSTTAAPLNTVQITQNLVQLCGSFRGHLQCVHGIVGTTCGPDTEAFASKFLSQMASPLLNICDKYAVDGSQNSPSDGTRSSGTIGATMAMAVVMLVLS